MDHQRVIRCQGSLSVFFWKTVCQIVNANRCVPTRTLDESRSVFVSIFNFLCDVDGARLACCNLSWPQAMAFIGRARSDHLRSVVGALEMETFLAHFDKDAKYVARMERRENVREI